MAFMVDARKSMVGFLARKANEAEIHVKVTRNGDLVIPTKREGAKLATIAYRYGWSVTPRGLSWSYNWLGWPESDEGKAEQLAVLRHEIKQVWGTDEVFGSEYVHANVIVANAGDA